MVDAGIAIVGIGQTLLNSQSNKLSIQELIFDASFKALADAGIDRSEIDYVMLAAHDVDDGRGITNMQNAAPAGSYLKDGIRVASDGVFAAIAARLVLLSGRANTALVVSWGKPSDADISAVLQTNFDPFTQRQVVLGEPQAMGLAGAALMSKHGHAEIRDAADKVGFADRAQMPKSSTIHRPEVESDLSRDSYLSWPLTEWDRAIPADGACAMVMCRADQVSRFPNTPAWVRGVGLETETFSIGDRDLTQSPSLRRAARTALASAGLSIEGVQVLELAARSTFEELIAISSLLDETVPELDRITKGSEELLQRGIALNLSGGGLGCSPGAATGLMRLSEVVLQLTGRSATTKAPGAKVGIANGTMGICMQSNAVIVVSTD